MANTPANSVKVSGKLELRESTKCFYWRVMLTWYANGKRHRMSVKTGLTETDKKNTRNKGRAKELLKKAVNEQEALLSEVMENQEPLSADSKAVARDISFANFMEHDWLEAVRRGDRKANKRKVATTTFGGYQCNVIKSIAPYFRDKGIRLSELTADDIDDFYEYHYDRGVSGKTIVNYHANIVSALKYAARKDYIDSAESILKNVLRPDAEDYEANPYSKAEAKILLEAVKGHRLEFGVIVGAYYGLRRSEIIGLRWSAIDFDANTIKVKRTVTETYIDGKRVILENERTKSKSSMRTMHLTPVMRAKLLAMKAEQDENRKLCGNSYNKKEGEYIYVDVLGNRIKPDYISSMFPKFLEKNGLRRIRFHDLRHTSACLLLDSGAMITEVQEWLGHSSIVITNKFYAKHDKSVNKRSADKLTWMDSTSLAQEFEITAE